MISDINIDLRASAAADAERRSFVGFGARTSSGAEEHNLLSWSLTSAGRSPTLGQAATIDLALAQEHFTVYGGETMDELTRDRTVAVGDLNGDGVQDLILGSPNNGGGIPAEFVKGADEVYVFFGGPDMQGTRDVAAAVGASLDVTITAATEGDGLSQGVALTVGDVNGDCTDDLILGADCVRGPGNNRRFSGAAYVIFGGDFSHRGAIDLAMNEQDVTIFGPTAADFLTGADDG
ncbi:MAG: hypothetical protein CMJ64_24840 [Planctomycetaceae bacterium]|nr:hypothetical protein [Planctomycetaceae bacterium]